MTALTATAERSRASRDPLLQPLRIKHLVLKNRIMSTSHASGLEVDGLPTERYQLYHELDFGHF
jgi:2,4-dienoyl-CoA reductase-like NADH-dependent reductase (Old Yellow Enzyme family)